MNEIKRDQWLCEALDCECPLITDIQYMIQEHVTRMECMEHVYIFQVTDFFFARVQCNVIWGISILANVIDFVNPLRSCLQVYAKDVSLDMIMNNSKWVHMPRSRSYKTFGTCVFVLDTACSNVMIAYSCYSRYFGEKMVNKNDITQNLAQSTNILARYSPEKWLKFMKYRSCAYVPTFCV